LQLLRLNDARASNQKEAMVKANIKSAKFHGVPGVLLSWSGELSHGFQVLRALLVID